MATSTRRETEQGPAGASDAATARALKLYVVLVRAAAAANAEARRDIARHDLTEAEFAVLEALHHKGPLLLRDVQRRILVSSGGITYLVDRLETRGLVERRACTTDRRATYAALTRAGQRLIRRIFPDHAACITQALAGLSAAEQESATALLRRLGQHAASLAAASD